MIKENLKSIKDYKLKCVIVSVDYTDILGITLPINRRHFDEVLVVTSCKEDKKLYEICREQNAKVYLTNSFYDDGASFNKWKALEEALDHYNRFPNSWLCLLDADIVWPINLPMVSLIEGNLYSPLRRMMNDVSIPFSIPPHEKWSTRFNLHQNFAEWAGYTQIFHTNDYHLDETPWHEIDWKHAGGADSIFQFKWSGTHKIRLPFEVLHLGRSGLNWCGRATNYLDGTTPYRADEKIKELKDMISKRTRGEDRYKEEKIKKN